MKITRKQIRQILKEEGYYHKLPKYHVDGHPWVGSLEDLAYEQGRTWGHGALVDPSQYTGHLKKARDLATGNDYSPLRTTRSQLQEMIKELIKQL